LWRKIAASIQCLIFPTGDRLHWICLSLFLSICLKFWTSRGICRQPLGLRRRDVSSIKRPENSGLRIPDRYVCYSHHIVEYISYSRTSGILISENRGGPSVGLFILLTSAAVSDSSSGCPGVWTICTQLLMCPGYKSQQEGRWLCAQPSQWGRSAEVLPSSRPLAEVTNRWSSLRRSTSAWLDLSLHPSDATGFCYFQMINRMCYGHRYTNKW